MQTKEPLPISLSIVSYLFLISGVGAALHMVAAWFYAAPGGTLDFNVLGIWIFFGLRRYSISWRICALIFIWIDLIVLPIACVWNLAVQHVFYLEFLGRRIWLASPLWIAACAAGFLLTLWVYRVLTRPDIRNRFDDAPSDRS